MIQNNPHSDLIDRGDDNSKKKIKRKTKFPNRGGNNKDGNAALSHKIYDPFSAQQSYGSIEEERIEEIVVEILEKKYGSKVKKRKRPVDDDRDKFVKKKDKKRFGISAKNKTKDHEMDKILAPNLTTTTTTTTPAATTTTVTVSDELIREKVLSILEDFFGMSDTSGRNSAAIDKKEEEINGTSETSSSKENTKVDKKRKSPLSNLLDGDDQVCHVKKWALYAFDRKNTFFISIPGHLLEAIHGEVEPPQRPPLRVQDP